MEDTRRTRPSESAKQSACELAETEAASTGATPLCLQCVVYILLVYSVYSYWVSVF